MLYTKAALLKPFKRISFLISLYFVSNFSFFSSENKISEIKVSYSFFPQEGIFNQLIATGSFELIENKDLKLLLLKILKAKFMLILMFVGIEDPISAWKMRAIKSY